ncbi:MAG: 50S ribosomal protein L25 [Syntrophomonadaceae bacterium]|nr:50S ribosomal protein L25 [Syntrophomonadaceae bacterium]
MTEVLEVELRGQEGTGRLREAGLAPGVVYGGDKPNRHVQFDRRRLEYILAHSRRGINTLLELRLGEGPQRETDTVIIREIQRDPVERGIRHADFYRISLSERITAEVPLAWLGVPAGVKAGGRLQAFKRTLEVECLPDQIPSVIEVRVDRLNLGERLSVAELPVPEGVRVLHRGDEPVVGVVAAREEPAAALPSPEAEAAPAAEGKAREVIPPAAK